jgi:hypothetical protein
MLSIMTAAKLITTIAFIQAPGVNNQSQIYSQGSSAPLRIRKNAAAYGTRFAVTSGIRLLAEGRMVFRKAAIGENPLRCRQPFWWTYQHQFPSSKPKTPWSITSGEITADLDC